MLFYLVTSPPPPRLLSTLSPRSEEFKIGTPFARARGKITPRVVKPRKRSQSLSENRKRKRVRGNVTFTVNVVKNSDWNRDKVMNTLILPPPKLKRRKSLRKRFEKSKFSKQDYFYNVVGVLQRKRQFSNSNGYTNAKKFIWAGGGGVK